MKNALILSLTSLILIACGPSLEQIEAREKFKLDSIEQFNILKNKILKDANKEEEQRFYFASDLGLPTGTIVSFAPTDEDIASKSEGGVCSEPIYVSIVHDDGHISIHQTDYKTWVNVLNGSIIK